MLQPSMLYFSDLKLFLERGFLFPPLKSVDLDFHSESQEEKGLHTNDLEIEVKGFGGGGGGACWWAGRGVLALSSATGSPFC